ncbi:phospholipid/cholesterol/gamma-HCH transport system substrate-binding protein [Mucilaginibacter gracilis]|uniref:Phospholipid/cholesterol/gamma-HCH transport system substrate-binding protein n=1 Tax=Mucilaginibacter gracilis TaxID=423350 RepID=A0A495IZN1_9SPHI|nr:MlaD family protein [Mucilaginibacter gracilis]RKR81973.1 phospholipid/cholesterol/gamma-HCH transport system substrate-binding protein [Mucilaginibacter gracilis]
MANETSNNTKLGVFVLAGLIALIATFYMIGKNHNLFAGSFELRTRFPNLNGLIVGNNVLFAGIQGGTVKSIRLINDTSIEVTMTIDDKVSPFIHKNALAAIGTDGLMGNKVVNISAVKTQSPLVQSGDMLATKKMLNTEEMLQTLSKTNSNIALISEGLKTTVLRINESSVWGVLNDKDVGISLKTSLNNIVKATGNANQITLAINHMVIQAKNGKGTLGVLLADTVTGSELKQAISQVKAAGANSKQMTAGLNTLVQNLNKDLASGDGPLHMLLKDTAVSNDLKKSMENIQKGTDSFNQDMEALKHNFLFKGYFKNLEKEKLKQQTKKK